MTTRRIDRSITLLLSLLAATVLPCHRAVADDAPAPRQQRAWPEDKATADKLARCAANYTFQVRMLKAAGGKPDALTASMEWHWERAIALSDEAYTEERFKVHYRNYQALDREFAKIDAKKEPERARAEMTRILASLNTDSDDCDLLRKARMQAETAKLERSCAEGAAEACVSLALLHAKGDGVPKDTARAAVLYAAACDAGRTVACNNLGVLYFNGDGVPKDAARAAALYDKACQGGNARSCSNLAGLYRNGDGVAVDAERADALFQKACDGGFASACARRAKAGAAASR